MYRRTRRGQVSRRGNRIGSTATSGVTTRKQELACAYSFFVARWLFRFLPGRPCPGSCL